MYNAMRSRHNDLLQLVIWNNGVESQQTPEGCVSTIYPVETFRVPQLAETGETGVYQT